MKERSGKAIQTDWIHPKGSGIRIHLITNRNEGEDFGPSYLLTIPVNVTGGGRKRKQFPTLQAAKNWAVDQYPATHPLGHEFFQLASWEQRQAVEV